MISRFVFPIALFSGLVAASVPAQLLNEQGERAPLADVSKNAVPGALFTDEGKFFCNAFAIQMQAVQWVFSAAHCLQPLDPGVFIDFVWLDAMGQTQRLRLGEPHFQGDPEHEHEPVDFVAFRVQRDVLSTVAHSKAAEQAGSYTVDNLAVGTGQVLYFHYEGLAHEGPLRAYRVRCTLARAIPPVRVVAEALNRVAGLDFQIGISAKGVEYDQNQMVFLDKCERPLPVGASGAAVLGDAGEPVAVLHTGVTTHHFALGWGLGGWEEKFWNRLDTRADAPDRSAASLTAYFMASDGKAYGPLPERVFEGRGDPLFLFSAAVRLDRVAKYLK